MSHSVVCFGEILWDYFGKDKKAGGAPMNVALHLHRQGVASTLISAVGADDDGKELLKFLEEHKVNTQNIQVNPSYPTGTVTVHLDQNLQATYTIEAPVAWDYITYQDKYGELAATADAVVFGSLVCRNSISRNTLLELLRRAKLKIFDMNLRPPHFTAELLNELLQHTDILKLNEHELEFLIKNIQSPGLTEEQLLKYLAETHRLQMICVTLGERGAMIWNGDTLYRHSGFKVDVVDTVGAGDAFLASFIKGLLSKTDLGQVLETACATGALVASKAGANPDYAEADIVNISA